MTDKSILTMPIANFKYKLSFLYWMNNKNKVFAVYGIFNMTTSTTTVTA